jgi:hypothetical protein
MKIGRKTGISVNESNPLLLYKKIRRTSSISVNVVKCKGARIPPSPTILKEEEEEEEEPAEAATSTATTTEEEEEDDDDDEKARQASTLRQSQVMRSLSLSCGGGSGKRSFTVLFLLSFSLFCLLACLLALVLVRFHGPQIPLYICLVCSSLLASSSGFIIIIFFFFRSLLATFGASEQASIMRGSINENSPEIQTTTHDTLSLDVSDPICVKQKRKTNCLSIADLCHASTWNHRRKLLACCCRDWKSDLISAHMWAEVKPGIDTNKFEILSV